jgi:hypothetical protein
MLWAPRTTIRVSYKNFKHKGKSLHKNIHFICKISQTNVVYDNFILLFRIVLKVVWLEDRYKHFDPNIWKRVLVLVIHIFTKNTRTETTSTSSYCTGINKHWENYNKWHVIVRSHDKVYIHVYACTLVLKLYFFKTLIMVRRDRNMQLTYSNIK